MSVFVRSRPFANDGGEFNMTSIVPVLATATATTAPVQHMISTCTSIPDTAAVAASPPSAAADAALDTSATAKAAIPVDAAERLPHYS